ncbi:hypothetical protein BDM02DRAFT_3128716 [Thelephora ganbajun]|uniref:Uncharacterized protein n=1 Tax=Thelephora ganbajun TaxID=370292 RepID=A0ACB6ZH14_THEGA|nr:hypothetical protein BDM02DRAFT_3128716 [Thelephora ganbajun]
MAPPYDAHTPAECPISKLPVELVIHIMRSELDPLSQRSLSQVSRGFRGASFLVPEFSSTIVPKFPLEKDQLDYWKRSIANSRTAPLDIKLTIRDRNSSSEVDQNQGFLPLFLELVIHATRWRTFVLVTAFPAPMNMFLKGTISVAVFPHLENLKLEACAEPVNMHGTARYAYGRPRESSSIMPKLRNLTLWNVWACHPRGVLNDLVDLKIAGDLFGTTPPLEEIVAMLKSSPNLEVLCLTAASPSLNNLSPPPVTNEALHVVLPRLRSLNFRGLSRMAGISTLPLLHLPALEEFHLENTSVRLDSCINIPGRPQIPEDYSSVIQIITYLNMPWARSSGVFTAPPGPQWPQGKLKELTLSWVTAEAIPLFEWLSFMRGLTTLRTQSSDVDLFRVLQDGNLCPRLEKLCVEGFMDPAARNELGRVIRARPNLEVLVEATPAGPGRIFSSLS